MPAWILRTLAGLALFAMLWLHGCHHGKGLERKSHAEVLQDIADKTADAAAKAHRARALYGEQAEADVARHATEIEDAYEAGRVAASGIGDGSVRVRTVWRDRACPAAVPRAGTEPIAGHPAVDQGRADAIGRILGAGWGWDATYGLAYSRLTRAQELLDACYEEPATGE